MRLLTALVVFCLLWLTIVALPRHLMQMGTEGGAGGCFLNGKMEVCAINLSEYLALWQGALEGSSQRLQLTVAVILAMMAAVVLRQRLPFGLFKVYDPRWRVRPRQNPSLDLFRYLREEFSRGILHSQIYPVRSRTPRGLPRG